MEKRKQKQQDKAKPLGSRVYQKQREELEKMVKKSKEGESEAEIVRVAIDNEYKRREQTWKK